MPQARATTNQLGQNFGASIAARKALEDDIAAI